MVRARYAEGQTVPRKRASKNKDEIIREFYGINRETLEIESASVTRGGTLSKVTGDGYRSHHIEHGRDARSEVIIVFGLIEIVEVHPTLTGDEQKRQIIEQLLRKATAMKAEREAREAEAREQKSEGVSKTEKK